MNKENVLHIIGIALLLLMLNSLGCSSHAQEAHSQPLPKASLILSDSITMAGSPIYIKATVEVDTMAKSLALIWSDALGDKYYPVPLLENEVQFSMPDSVFCYSGAVQLSLLYQSQKLDQTSIQILPNAASGVIETYAGSKTMVTNSQQAAMVIAIPKDTFGNAMPDNAAVQLSWRYPKANEEQQTQVIKDMTAALRLPSGPNSGKLLVGASLGNSRSIEETIELTPGWPQSFRIELENWYPFADARQLVSIRSQLITDQNGNKVADGTAIHFVVLENGHPNARYRSMTSNGIAQVYIENPERATKWEVYALAEGGIRSNSLQLSFKAAVQELPFKFDPSKFDIIIGPVTNNLGQMVADDFRISIQLDNQAQQFEFEGKTEAGFYRLELPESLPPMWYRCKVLAGGKENVREIEIKR